MSENIITYTQHYTGGGTEQRDMAYDVVMPMYMLVDFMRAYPGLVSSVVVDGLCLAFDFGPPFYVDEYVQVVAGSDGRRHRVGVLAQAHVRLNDPGVRIAELNKKLAQARADQRAHKMLLNKYAPEPANDTD